MKPIGSNSRTSSPRNGFAVYRWRSPAERSEAGRLEGWQPGTAVVRGHPSRRIAFAMLLRMRVGEHANMIRTSETLN
jgi:hypothetical protein